MALPALSRTSDNAARSPRAEQDVRLAAIDIGSNSIRQIVADVSPSGSIRVVDEMKAAPRLGGKVLTARFEKSGIAFEGGTAELYDYSMHGTDPLRELVNELGLKTMPFKGGVVALGDRILRSADDVRRVYGARTLSAIRAFHRQCAEILDTEDYYEGIVERGERKRALLDDV